MRSRALFLPLLQAHNIAVAVQKSQLMLTPLIFVLEYVNSVNMGPKHLQAETHPLKGDSHENPSKLKIIGEPSRSFEPFLRGSAECTGTSGHGSPAAPSSTVSYPVGYSDLDVSKMKGAKTLYLRIRYAAETLCESAASWGKKEGEACVNKAVNDAVTHIDAPLLKQYNQRRSKGEKAGLVQLAKVNRANDGTLARAVRFYSPSECSTSGRAVRVWPHAILRPIAGPRNSQHAASSSSAMTGPIVN